MQQQCVVTKGDEPLNITWSLNGEDASTVSGVHVLKFGSRTSILAIESVRAYHGGNYTCNATNAAGSIHFTAQLAVNGIMLQIYSYSLLFSSHAFSLFPIFQFLHPSLLLHLAKKQ